MDAVDNPCTYCWTAYCAGIEAVTEAVEAQFNAALAYCKDGHHETLRGLAHLVDAAIADLLEKQP